MSPSDHPSESEILAELLRTLAGRAPLVEFLPLLLNRCAQAIPAAGMGYLLLWDPSARLLRPRAALGYNLKLLKELGLRLGEGLAGKVYQQGRALSQPDPAGDLRPANRAALARALPGSDAALPVSAIAAPLMVDRQALGVLQIEAAPGAVPLPPSALPWVQTLADLAALAVERERLAEEAGALRKTERLRSDLLATLSHELRLPLTAIQGYTSTLLLDEIEWSPEKRQEFLQQIDAECHNMETMLKQLLDSALIDVDHLVIERQPVRLQQVAREVATDAQHRAPIHKIMVDFPPTFPLLEADPHWMRQVFRNILDNSVKYSPDGGLIVIRGEARMTDVVISVADQGVGIPPEDLASLFDRYFRARSPLGAQAPGTGLGLQIARTIVEAHGGHIWAESKPRQGTTLSFTLPLNPPISYSNPHDMIPKESGGS